MDILKALIALMCYCNEREDCVDCPFNADQDTNYPGACLLFKVPATYDLNLIAKAISKINEEILEDD